MNYRFIQNNMIYRTIVPNDYDVLMGQSPNLRLHPGNKRLKELVARKFDEYFAQSTSKLDKTFIAKGIIQQVLDNGGRFLKQPSKKRVATIKDAVWAVEDDPVRIRDKVASQFRGHLKETKRRKSGKRFSNYHKEQQIKREPEIIAPSTEVVVHRGPLKKRKIKFDGYEDEHSSSCDSSFEDNAAFQKDFQQTLKQFEQFESQSKHKNIKIETVENERKNLPTFVKTETGMKVPPSGETAQDKLDRMMHLDFLQKAGRLPPSLHQENEYVDNAPSSENIISSAIPRITQEIENLRRYNCNYNYNYDNHFPSMQSPLVNMPMPLDHAMLYLQAQRKN